MRVSLVMNESHESTNQINPQIGSGHELNIYRHSSLIALIALSGDSPDSPDSPTSPDKDEITGDKT